MSESSKYSPFTAADIERYLSGKMSPGERHALEKAALEDPFLADAMEGYVHTSSMHGDLSSLRNRLSEKTGKKKAAIPFFRNNSFMRAAAIFLVIAGAGIFIIKWPNSPEKEIANTQSLERKSTQTPANKEVAAQPGKTIFTDTISPKNDLVYAKPDKIGNGYIRKLPERTENSSNRTIESSMERTSVSAALPPVTMADAGMFKDTGSSIALKDLEGVEIQGDSIKNLNIVMVESDQVLNEVVVLNKRANRTMADAPAKPVEEIEPIGGWVGYNNYALSNLKPPQGSENKPHTGDVVLSFDINTLGEPTNIKVVESFCTSCEDEAKRILLEGPKWKNKNKRNAKIRIRF